MSVNHQQGESSNLPVVGVVMKSLSAEFFKDMQKGVISRVKKRGDLTILALGTQSQLEVAQQVAIVKRLITRKVDAIIIVPIDSVALVPPLAQASKAGIPIVCLDVMLNQEYLEKYKLEIPFIGPDHLLAAKAVADQLAKEIGAGGKVAILEGIPEASNAIQRKNGFMRSIEENKLDLVDSQAAYWETNIAEQVFKKMYSANPDIQGLMCANDAMALGAIQVLEEMNSLEKVKIVSIDNDNSIRAWIERGVILTTIDLLPKEMAAKGIDLAMDSIKGKKQSGWLKTPTKLITKDNLTMWEIVN